MISQTTTSADFCLSRKEPEQEGKRQARVEDDEALPMTI
jgi:hypothetical protein